MLCFPSVRPSVCSFEISASRPARDFKSSLCDSSQGLILQNCKKIWWTHRWGGGGQKGGFSIQNFKVWLAICQNITKFDGEYDGAHPRNNWTQGQDLVPGFKDLEPIFFKLQLAICQNITKFDGEHDGAYPRTNWTQGQDLVPGFKDLEPIFLNYSLRYVKMQGNLMENTMVHILGPTGPRVRTQSLGLRTQGLFF